MVMAVGFGFGPDDEEFVAEDDLDCPDPEDLLDPAVDALPPALLLAADPAQLPGQWVDHGMSTWFAHTNRTTLQLARWMLESARRGRCRTGARDPGNGLRRSRLIELGGRSTGLDQGLERQAQFRGQGRHREEGRGGHPSRLDLAQRLHRHPHRRGDGGHRP
jgi:hypothetical protein